MGFIGTGNLARNKRRLSGEEESAVVRVVVAARWPLARQKVVTYIATSVVSEPPQATVFAGHAAHNCGEIETKNEILNLNHIVKVRAPHLRPDFIIN